MTLIDFVNQSDNSLALRSDVNVQKSNAKELGKIFHSLARGKYPLLLYPHHVVMVIQMEYKRAYDGNITVRLVFYDPDDNRRSKNKVFSVKADWSETINAMPIFML